MPRLTTEYLNFKKSFPDALLFYRLGGFYELYFEDAIIAAKALNIALNHRKIAGEKIATCGFPVNSLKNFSNKLLQSGFKIAIAEQFIDPDYPQKITRQINKILTAGTCADDEFFGEQENILLAIVQKNQKLDLCFGNILLGDFYVDEIEESQINQYLENIKPAEILCADKIILAIINPKFHHQISFYQPNSNFKFSNQTFKTLSQYHNLALRNIFAYVDSIHNSSTLSHFKIHQYQNPKYLKIDQKTINNLELGKIIKIIDRTNCEIGSRFLRSAILKPLCEAAPINNRLSGVEFLIAQNDFLKQLQNYLKDLPDLEKIIGKMILTKNSNINNLTLILQALKLMVKINETLFWQNNSKKTPTIFNQISKKLFADFELINFLDSAIDPRRASFQSGFNIKLDNYKKLQQNIIQEINQLEKQYQNQSQIKNLKIEFNNLLGFYFEIKRDKASKINIPQHWQLLQNLSNSIRFSSADLKNYQLENAALEAKIKTLESEILQECVQKVLQYFVIIKSSCKAIGALDLLTSFADLAIEKNYIKPIIHNQNLINIIAGKHSINPDFIGNDCLLDAQKIWLITGANMAGKSTFLKQNALIIILAQAGCFVPADFAEIGVRKEIFSKMMINDDLAKNQSSFMVEMLQIAEILNNANADSLVIIDELCQTTNASEGEEIAFKIIQYLLQHNKSLTLISTHQPNLAKNCQNLQNIICKKIDKAHRITNGIAACSSAMKILKMAGLPEEILK
ncbi:MAG: DNA mismatch repair protein MutS [Pseudomonadota bacterium]